MNAGNLGSNLNGLAAGGSILDGRHLVTVEQEEVVDSLVGGQEAQLIGDVRQPITATPGQLERHDCEYRRNGMANLFVFLDAHRPWRHVKVMERRTARDSALCMRDLADTHYPKAELIRVVLDNLSTHTAGALYETFPAPKRTAFYSAWNFTTRPSTQVG